MLDTRKKMGYIGLLALNFMSMFLIACMGVVGYAMAGEFDAVSQVGLVFALETCFRCTVCPISGKLGEKLGRKQLLIGALIVCTAAYAVAAFATNFTVILVTRCLAGAAWACWMVNSFLLFCDLFGQSEGPKYSGIAQTVGTVSILIAAPVAGLPVLRAHASAVLPRHVAGQPQGLDEPTHARLLRAHRRRPRRPCRCG